MHHNSLPDNVIITQQRKTDLNKVISKRNYSGLVVLVDSNTRKACYPKLSLDLPEHTLIEIQAGEENKNLQTCSQVWQALTDFHVERKGLLLILGGGVPGDLGGFCAATYKRGIDFILMPTTLLSQVDASVGGKLGVDFAGFKNHIGIFQEPVATIIDTTFLETLSETELRSGFAEVIKHCLLSDLTMWNSIRAKSLHDQDWEALVYHSVAFKARVTQADPKESGLRKILNFGHTIGHAVESYFLETNHRLLHGEAIAIGMLTESWLAVQKQLMTPQELMAIQDFILKIFGRVELPTDTTGIAQLALQDKKNVGGKILLAVPQNIGQAIWDVAVTVEEIQSALAYYANLAIKA